MNNNFMIKDIDIEKGAIDINSKKGYETKKVGVVSVKATRAFVTPNFEAKGA